MRWEYVWIGKRDSRRDKSDNINRTDSGCAYGVLAVGKGRKSKKYPPTLCTCRITVFIRQANGLSFEAKLMCLVFALMLKSERTLIPFLCLTAFLRFSGFKVATL
jgi:hypothetical protein